MSANYFQEDEILGKAYDARLTRRLLTYLRPYRLLVAAGVVLLLLGALADLAGPYIVKTAIDNDMCPALRLRTGVCHAALSASRPLGSTADHQRGLLRAAILFLLALVAGFAIRYSQEVLLNYLGQRVMYDLRMQIFTRLQRLPLAFFDRNPVGRLMTRLTNDVDALNEMLTDGAVAIFGDIFTLLGIVGVLLWLNWRLALVTFVILPVLVVFMSLFRRAMRDSYRQVRTRLARLNAYIAENISGTQIVQLFNREQRNFTAFDALNLDYLGANLRSLFYFALFYPTVSVLSSVAIALIVWYGGGNVLAPAAGGSRGVLPALTLGSLVAFLSYADRFFVPIRDLSEKYNILQGAMAASERIFGLLDEPETIVDPPVGRSSKHSCRPKSFGATHCPEGPPTCTASASPPPTRSSSSFTVMPKGTSKTPGNSQSPETLTRDE